MLKAYRTYLQLLLVFSLAGLCACSPMGSEAVPLTLFPTSVRNTKGYVEGTSMDDTSPSTLHSSYPTRHLRTVTLTSWLTEKDGAEQEYFRDREFCWDTDGLWHAVPSLYWPLEGTLDFIGYSSSIPFVDGNVQYDPYRSTDGLKLTFDREYTQDDVLFTSASGKKVTDSLGNVPMSFGHSQAWIQFKLRSKTPSFDNIVKVRKLILQDIYTTGVLEVQHPFGYAEGRWSFRFDRRQDTVVDDVHGIYGTYMDGDYTYLDMLIPEQPMKDILLEYSYNGSDPVMQYRFTLPSAYWQMGKKYVYEISFAPNEITFVPTVQNWNDYIEPGVTLPE